MRRLPLPVLLALLATGCATPSVIPPRPAPPVPVPTPSPSPTPTPSPAPAPPPSADWRDWALTPGEWAWRQDDRGSIALFGRAGGDAELTLRCDRARGRIYLSRRGEGPRALTIRTTSMLRTIPVQPVGGAAPYLAAELAPGDALIDAIGFSRGRFIVESAGLPTLVVPAWSEILRVAEDCRG